MSEQNKKNKKEQRQSWKPHWLVDILQKLCKVALSLVKVALAAVATVVLIVVICGFVLVGLLGSYLQEDIHADAEIVKENYDLDETSYMHYVDADGNIQELQKIYASTTDREWATYDQIPEDLIHAAVAIEDKRFYEHQGVDWITTVKACAKMFVGTGDAGGSTITQQLVKNMTGDNSVTVRRKVVEIFKAVDFERRYDKDVIMEWYLNLIYFGDRKNGVKSAAAHYFGKELQDLTTAECASLISITNNPSIFSPYASTFEYKGELMSGKERNHIRKENTLWSMRNQGFLTEEEYQAALAQELVFKSGIAHEDSWAVCENPDCGYEGTVKTLNHTDDKYTCPECEQEILVSENASQEMYSWFVETVLEDVASDLAERDGMKWENMSKEQRGVYTQLIQRAGYHIYTTLDMKVQNQVDVIYTNLDEIPETRGGQQLQSGIIVIDNRTGDIVAMSGGVGEKVVFDAYNLAVDARQQVGSSFKPVGVYAPAFELGVISPATVIKDMPLKYSESGAFPNNAERYYVGSKTVLGGVVSSVNAVAVNTLDLIGTRYSFNFAKEKFRISGLVENGPNGTTDVDYSPLGLGGLSVGASVRDMASAYATFANKGVYREGRTYTKVYDSEGNLILDNTQEAEQILSQKTVDYMNYCLDEAVRRGTGTKADFDGMDICGKTGTTNSNKVRYFCGYTGHYTAAVWCGYEIPAQIQLVGDTTNPAIRLWKKVMQPIHKGKESIPMYNKDNMVEITVCLDSGKLVTDACVNDIRDTKRVESVLVYPEDIPEEYCDKHIALEYCSEGKAVANEYCKKFAEVGKLELTGTGLLKLTQQEVDERIKAGKYGLKKEYLNSKYVYLVDGAGEPAGFKGFSGELDGSGPCISCTKHTKESWEQFKAQNPWVDKPEVQDPVVPDNPENPTEDPQEPTLDPTQPTVPPEEEKTLLDKIKDFFQGEN